MQQQLQTSPAGIPEIQLPVQNKLIRNYLYAMAAALSTRGHAPGVLVVPEKDRHELRSAMKLLAHFVDENTEPVFIRNEQDLVDYVFEETHHRPVVYLDAENIPREMQQRAVDYWTQASLIRPPVTVFVIDRDPGDIMNEGIWLKSFREMMHMPTFRWPESQARLKSPKHRLSFFLEVFSLVGRKQFGVEPPIEPGARDFLLSEFFAKFAPKYTGNYVKLAADLIATMRTFGEERLTTKIVISLTAPGHDFALG